MMYLACAAVISMGALAIDLIAKQKVLWYRYLFIFVVTFVIYALFEGKGNAEQPLYDRAIFAPTMAHEKVIIEDYLSNHAILAPRKEREFKRLAADHKKMGLQAYGEAKNICVLLPCIEQQRIAEDVFAAAAAMAMSGNLYSGICVFVMTALVQYGFAVINEWYVIKNKLEAAKEHFEMNEFYLVAIEKG